MGGQQLPLGKEPEHGEDPLHGLRVALSESIPRAPVVLSRLEAHAVEDAELQRVRVVVRPTIADGGLPARVEPLVLIDRLLA